MSLDSGAILSQLASHCLTTGHFARVATHDPKNPPAGGLTAALWVDRIVPDPRNSGLASTSVVVAFILRVYQTLVTEPADDIDPTVTRAIDAVANTVTGDFTLGGTVMGVDLLGAAGIPMEVRAGYVEHDGGAMSRVMDLTIPVKVNDVWTQVP